MNFCCARKARKASLFTRSRSDCLQAAPQSGLSCVAAAHLGVVVAEMHDELVDAGRQRRQHLLVRLEPPLGRHARVDRQHAVEERIRLRSRGPRRLLPAALAEPLDEQGQAVAPAQPAIDREQLRRLEQRPHVRVEVADADARRPRPLDLRPQLALHLAGPGPLGHRGLDEREVAVRIEQAAHPVPGAERSPAKAGPLAVERQVDSEVGIRVAARECGDFGEPRADHENARRCDPAVLERLERGAIDRVRHAEVVGVEDQEAGIGGMAEALLERRRLALRGAGASRGRRRRAPASARPGSAASTVGSRSRVHRREHAGPPGKLERAQPSTSRGLVSCRDAGPELERRRRSW